jgi:hypothetical protein
MFPTLKLKHRKYKESINHKIILISAEIIGDRLRFPQFNGDFNSATMSPKEYPDHETEKSL